MNALSSLFADLQVVLILLNVPVGFIYETDRLFYYFRDFSFTFLQNLR